MQDKHNKKEGIKGKKVCKQALGFELYGSKGKFRPIKRKGNFPRLQYAEYPTMEVSVKLRISNKNCPWLDLIF